MKATTSLVASDSNSTQRVQFDLRFGITVDGKQKFFANRNGRLASITVSHSSYLRTAETIE